MRMQEKDRDIKIPSWYYKLPLWFVELLSDIALEINHRMPTIKKNKKTINTKFCI